MPLKKSGFMPACRVTGKVTSDKKGVGAANAAGADADPHFAARRRRGLDLGELQRRTRGLNVNCFM